MSERWKAKRRPYEFSHETKRLGFQLSHQSCECCGVHKKEGYLEAHHVLGVFYAFKEYKNLSPVIIKSLCNLEILCIDCHTRRHEDEDIDQQMDEQAQFLITLQDLCQYTDPQLYNALYLSAMKNYSTVRERRTVQIPMFAEV